MTIFVRHGHPRVDPEVDSSEWSLDTDAVVAVAKLAALLPTSLPILSSDERKARETAMVIGAATTDPRLG
jgi:hypothetical protein